MYDILVDGQLVAVCAEGVLKLFVESLVRALGPEMSIQTKRHEDHKSAPAEEKK